MESFTFLTSSSSTVTLLLLFLCSFLPSHAAAAVLAPNMSSCHLASNLPDIETPFRCCAPIAEYEPRLFRPNASSSSSVLRVRRPAHTVDDAYAEKLARAYQLMKALPVEDPRSFVQQANIHCAYCNGAYNQMNSTQLFQVHGSWLFFPFHRWYMYFHERILGRLLGDDDFALPFWNYDHPNGASIPWIYSNSNLGLGDSLRDSPVHDAPAVVAIDFLWDTDLRSHKTQLRENDNTMFRSLIRDASLPKKFFGGAYRQGEEASSVYGTVERRPHNTVHNWLGKKSQIGWKDMGSLYAAARDPIFYAHHSQLDRLWEVWKTIPNHYDYDDADYLDAEFAFYNEDAELVRVKVADALNMSELGYVYQEVDTPWMDAIPVRRSAEPATLTQEDIVCVEGGFIRVPCSLVVERDNAEIVKDTEGLGEYMGITVEYSSWEGWGIDVYINLPSADAETDSGCLEYFDYYGVAAPLINNGSVVKYSKTTTKEVGEALAALNLTEASSMVVTLVPRGLNASTSTVTFLGLFFVYEASTELTYGFSLS